MGCYSFNQDFSFKNSPFSFWKLNVLGLIKNIDSYIRYTCALSLDVKLIYHLGSLDLAINVTDTNRLDLHLTQVELSLPC